MGSSGAEPAKGLLPYLQRADELQKHEPLVAYYCWLYAMEKGLVIPTKDRTKMTNSVLVSLINQLEKVTKLCDLGTRDSVCAVHWTREGSYLAIGTSLGDVQVCGLKWSHDDRELASGGNDNHLLIWNQRSQQPVLWLTKHTAVVKAIAWSPTPAQPCGVWRWNR